MSALLDGLLALASRQAPGERANEVLDEERAARATGDTAGLSYEVTLPALGGDEHLLHRALPRLVYFLDCRGLAPDRAPGVFVSLFSSRGLAVFDATTFAMALGQHRGLDAKELVRRYGAQGTGDPLALGTGR